MQIKICGITNAKDANFASNAGANAIGLMFCRESKRYVDIKTAEKIINSLNSFTSVVAVFKDQSHEEIDEIITALPINILQFHGSENLEFCESFQRPFIRAFVLQEPHLDFTSPFFTSRLMRGYLVDSGAGSGKVLDWRILIDKNPQIAKHHKPLILAGGLNPQNVGEAINIVKPTGVDVSSGVEVTGNAGLKDNAKILQFINNAKKYV